MSDSSPKTRSLVLEAHVPGTPEEVTRMLTDPAELARWFAPFVEGPPNPGGLVSFRWSPEVVWRTRAEVVEVGRRVRWRDPPGEEQQVGVPGQMLVEWTLGPEAGGTRLRLVNSGFGEGASWEDQYEGADAGWRFFLWHLEETLRHDRKEPRVVAWERRSSSLSRDALGRRLFGPEGLALEPPGAVAGSPARIALGGAPHPFELVHFSFPTHLWGKLPDLGGAILLVGMEPWRTGPVQTQLWLSTWGPDAAAREAVWSALRSTADAVFGPAPG